LLKDEPTSKIEKYTSTSHNIAAINPMGTAMPSAYSKI